MTPVTTTTQNQNTQLIKTFIVAFGAMLFALPIVTVITTSIVQAQLGNIVHAASVQPATQTNTVSGPACVVPVEEQPVSATQTNSATGYYKRWTPAVSQVNNNTSTSTSTTTTTTTSTVDNRNSGNTDNRNSGNTDNRFSGNSLTDSRAYSYTNVSDNGNTYTDNRNSGNTSNNGNTTNSGNTANTNNSQTTTNTNVNSGNTINNDNDLIDIL